MKEDKDIQLLYIDLFCGAGGTSTGVEKALINGRKCAKVIACVNHDANAIASHAANHPDALHYTEDIRTLDLTGLRSHVEFMRIKYPNAKVELGASIECINHSKAKGGMSRDADSRTLANDLLRYIIAIKPDIISIENVREFLIWGPLQIKVVKDKQGNELYCPIELKYCKKTKSYSCNPVWVPIPELKATDYNAWVKSVKDQGYKYEYRILNSADYGAYTKRERYFGQFVKPGINISWPEKTHADLSRIRKKKGHQLSLFKDQSLKEYLPVREVLDLYDEGESIFGRKKPLVEKTLERVYSGMVKFVAGGNDKFLACYYGTGDNCSSIDYPSPVVTTKDRIAIVQPQFIDQQYGNSKPVSLNQPAGTITVNPKLNLVSLKPWIMNTSFNNVGSSVDEPAQTITANRKWFYLMNPQYLSAGGSIDEPCFTLIARMDKAPPYLIQLEEGKVGIEIYETDSPCTVKIKQFMAYFGIVDVKMRMLYIKELKKIMGFSSDYKLFGNQTEQKKFIGNAVEVNTAKALVESQCHELYKTYFMCSHSKKTA